MSGYGGPLTAGRESVRFSHQPRLTSASGPWYDLSV